jgi:uncharacterized membrane protein
MFVAALGILSAVCFWQRIASGWSVEIVLQIIALFFVGVLLMQLCKRSGRSQRGAFLASAIFMVSIAPQAGLPKMYCGFLASWFALCGYKAFGLAPGKKFLWAGLFVILHILKYAQSLSVLTYVLPAGANIIFCLCVAKGVDTVLASKEPRAQEFGRKIRIAVLCVLPVFFLLLCYFRF